MIRFALHGGAGDDSGFIRQHEKAYKEALSDAARVAYACLDEGKSALDAVELAVRQLEDIELFNSGKGSALNQKGEIEMDAAIMDGHHLKAGAVSMVKNIRNLITLARKVMEETQHVYLSGYGAEEFARSQDIAFEESEYFYTEHQLDEFKKANKKESYASLLLKKIKGTVGAVALDKKGHVAAACSTGGSVNSLPGRIGDSCIIGAGCYANNKICALSGTGDGEYLITGAIAHSIAMTMNLLHCSLQEACDKVIHVDNKHIKGDLGVIGVAPDGQIGISFNTKRMHRAWFEDDGTLRTELYRSKD